MFTTNRSPIRTTNIDNSFNRNQSPQIIKIKKYDGELINYIYTKGPKVLDYQDENSSLIRNTFISNLNDQTNDSPYSNYTYNSPIKVKKKNKYEEKKYNNNNYSTNDSSITKLVGEVSSSYIKKIKVTQNKIPKKNSISNYLIKSPDLIRKRNKNGYNIINNEIYNGNTFNKSKLLKIEYKSKSIDVATEKERKKAKFNEENKSNVPEIKIIPINLNKGGVVNLTLNQIKKKYGEIEYVKEEEKNTFIQNYFREHKNNKKEDNKEEESEYYNYLKIEEFIQIIYNLILKEKRYLLNKLKIQRQYLQLKSIKRNLNYHKPIVKQKRKEDSVASLNQISNYFLPTNSAHESLKSLKENLLVNNFDISKNDFDDYPSSFRNLKYSEQNSLCFKGIKKTNRKSINELSENLNYKKLYENAEENLNKIKKQGKNFGFLYIRKKVNNIQYKPSKISSFKEIEMDFPEDGDFMYEAIKKKLQMKKRVNNIEIQGIKKNPYSWVQLPFAIKNLLLDYIYKQNCQVFMNKLKNISLLNKQEQKLKDNFKREENKILRKYFNKYNYNVLKLTDNEKLKKEKLNKLTITKEENFELERNIFDLSFHSDSFYDMDNNMFNSNLSLNYSFDKKRKSIKELKLENIPKQRKIFKNKIRSASRSISKIKKELERKERIRKRTLHFVDRSKSKNNSVGSQKNYKKIKVYKKVYDNVTGYKFNLIPKNFHRNDNFNSENNSEIEHKNFAEYLLNEDKNSKIKRLVKYNQLSHYFKFWKFAFKKNNKPKFYDIIKIMMKCLFTDNVYVKSAFMGELFFIKGRYLFKWFWNTVKNKKRKLRNKKSSNIINI